MLRAAQRRAALRHCELRLREMLRDAVRVPPTRAERHRDGNGACEISALASLQEAAAGNSRSAAQRDVRGRRSSPTRPQRAKFQREAASNAGLLGGVRRGRPRRS